MELSDFASIGESVRIEKTVSDADMTAFADISGDHDPIHTDDDYAKNTPFGKRIAFGLLVMSYLSGPESDMSKKIVARQCPFKPVSLGYEKVRFLAPVFLGDTLTITYTIESLDPEKVRSVGDCLITNQKGETVFVAKHIMKWIAVDG